MKVLLLKDVYKLGRAGDVKKVADGYGRNYLIPQGLAALATPGALKQAEHIKAKASIQRAILNKEMDLVAQKLAGVVLTFSAKASETGKLYGSITNQMIAESIQKKVGLEIQRRQIDSQPIRSLGEFKVSIRLTVDLIPTIKVIVHREGESPYAPGTEPVQPAVHAPAAPAAPAAVELPTAVETQAAIETPAAPVEAAPKAE